MTAKSLRREHEGFIQRITNSAASGQIRKKNRNATVLRFEDCDTRPNRMTPSCKNRMLETHREEVRMNEHTSIPGVADAPVRALPHSIEAEQAVLGALLVNNEVFDRLNSFLYAEHFYDPVHARIYETAGRRVQNGQVVSPITLRAAFENDPGMAELGGPVYLLNLADAAVSVFNVLDYGRMVYEMAIRRDLIQLGEDISDNAGDFTDDRLSADHISAAEQTLYSLAEKGRIEGGFKNFGRVVTEAVEVANAAYQRDGKLAGLSSGLRDMDTKLGGLHRSDLLILAGRPSMGKTALATNIAFNVAKAFREGPDETGKTVTLDGGVVGFFSLEMSAEQLATRILAEQCEISSEKIRRGELDEAQFRKFVEVARVLETKPLYIDDTPALTIGQLSARSRRLKRQSGLDLIVVDYLQLLNGDGRASDNRVNEISQITRGLKAIAKELDIPVIALSQLSRKVEDRDDKRPQLSDLRESGSIEQDADVVMFVYREEYYLSRTEPREGTQEHLVWMEAMDQVHAVAEVVIGKQRHGPIGIEKLHFEAQFTRFSDLAREERHSNFGESAPIRQGYDKPIGIGHQPGTTVDFSKNKSKDKQPLPRSFDD